MSSIGPQLPPHLAKRKRTPEGDDKHSPSSPNKTQRTQGPTLPANGDEIDLSDSDDDDDNYGPKMPSAPSGPSPPPNNYKNNDEVDIDSASSSDTSPAPPPELNHTKNDESDSSDDDDDDFGPSLPTAATTTRPTLGPSLPPAPSTGPQRDSWMLAPPESTGYTERDPTRIKARKFASSAKPTTPQAGVPSIWTETPEQKLQRLQDSVLGRSSAASSTAVDTAASLSHSRNKEDDKIAAKIEASRGKSLLDEHAMSRKKAGADKEEEDDPSKRAFDREKDMALGGKIGTTQRRELMDKAANFGGRFQKGSYL